MQWQKVQEATVWSEGGKAHSGTKWGKLIIANLVYYSGKEGFITNFDFDNFLWTFLEYKSPLLFGLKNIRNWRKIIKFIQKENTKLLPKLLLSS